MTLMAKKEAAVEMKLVPVELRYSGNLKYKIVTINDVELTFKHGIARFSLKSGPEHTLKWVVSGFVGAKWAFSLKPVAETYTVAPKTLMEGKSFTLEKSKEKKPFHFSVMEAQGNNDE